MFCKSDFQELHESFEVPLDGKPLKLLNELEDCLQNVSEHRDELMRTNVQLSVRVSELKSDVLMLLNYLLSNDIKACQEDILAAGNAKVIYYFARNVKGTDREACKEALINLNRKDLAKEL